MLLIPCCQRVQENQAFPALVARYCPPEGSLRPPPRASRPAGSAATPAPRHQGVSVANGTSVDESSVIRRPGESSKGSTLARPPGKTARACPGYAVDHIMPLKRGGLAVQGLRIHNPFNNLAGLGI